MNMPMDSVDVLLLFPPPFAVEQPYGSLPALTAFLIQKGLSVRQGAIVKCCG
jgi:hypothetical protein